MVRFFVWAVPALLILGCGRPQVATSRPAKFNEVYQQLSQVRPAEAMVGPVEAKLTLSAEAMPLGTFLRYVSDKTGVSVVCGLALDQRPVTVDLVDTPVSAALGVVARRLGVQVSRSGTMFYIGELRPEDKGVLVRKVTRLGADELKNAVFVLLSEFGRVSSYPDGLVVVGDRVEVLQRVVELLDRIEQAPSDSWVVQLYLAQLSQSAVQELGFDVTPSIDIASTFATLSGNVVGQAETSAKLVGGLAAVLRATGERRGASMVCEPLFLLVDGESAKFVQGVSVPIPKKSVSPEGTVTTTDYTYVQTGLQVGITLRDMGDGRARAAVSVELSDILGYVDSAPQTALQSFNTSAVLSSSGVYLLGSLTRQSLKTSVTGVFESAKKTDNVGDLVQIWARAFRIRGPVSGSAPSRPVIPGEPSTRPAT